MNHVLVAAVAVNTTPLAWEDNARIARQAISEARRRGAKVVCLPELCVSGYGCEDQFYSEDLTETALVFAQKLASETRGLFVAFGLPLRVGGDIYNAVAVAIDGKLRGFVAKQNLAGDGVHYEPRWFKAWRPGDVRSIDLAGERLPVGDLIFELDSVRIGFEICEDAWVAHRPAARLACENVDIILNPSASHFAFGKSAMRAELVLRAARDYGVGYVYANLLGCEAGRIIYDGDALIASRGAIVARGERFSFKEWVVTPAAISIKSRQKSKTRVTQNESARLVLVRGLKIRGGRKPSRSRRPLWERSKYLKHEEFSRAVMLGLFDYLRKSRAQGFVVSLSGGIDSSAVSCLVRLMLQVARLELGLKGLKQRLSHVAQIASIKSEGQLCRKLLTCVYQATAQSSEVTRSAAKGLARELGAEFYSIDIEPLVKGYKAIVSQALGVSLNWRDHDLALQNIQSRTRSPAIWLFANLKGALLITTSNRSEASVGYSTMDGDSSGGLAPLGGIDKAYLREWSRWLERRGPRGARAFPSLAAVNRQQPTAELRPAQAKQTDEGDLMPYVVLDTIERYAVRDKLSPLVVYKRLARDYRGRYTAKQLSQWVERFFHLWSVSQWKRERMAPSFHLDDESVDPKTWCRFPILSGGFKFELQDLKSFRR
jgi:NAD+ synthase (glutamine-hydrolysing)